jgi:hypothetical protein
MFDHIIIILFDVIVLMFFATWGTGMIWDGNGNLL